MYSEKVGPFHFLRLRSTVNLHSHSCSKSAQFSVPEQLYKNQKINYHGLLDEITLTDSEYFG